MVSYQGYTWDPKLNLMCLVSIDVNWILVFISPIHIMKFEECFYGKSETVYVAKYKNLQNPQMVRKQGHPNLKHEYISLAFRPPPPQSKIVEQGAICLL